MSDVRVTCINKMPRNNTHEGIPHLGDQGWNWTRAEVIRSIEDKSTSLFTMAAGLIGSCFPVKNFLYGGVLTLGCLILFLFIFKPFSLSKQ